MSIPGVITDSIHGLPQELVREYDIRVAPMGVTIDGKGYWDMVDITPAKFYPMLKKMNVSSGTNAPSPGHFLRIYESLSRITDSMVYISVSKAITATFENAKMARQMFLYDHPDIKIELIDSKNGAGAQGLLALEAARAAREGKSLPGIVELVQELIPRVKYLSVLETAKYLMRLGEVSRTAQNEDKAGSRPIGGMIDNSGLFRIITHAAAQQALDKLLELAGSLIEPGKQVHAIIQYSENVQEAEDLEKQFLSRFNCCELFKSEYTPTSLCSTGLMTGLSFYT
ncbi:MAG: DegV family EDD domain-containing protein [Dehalococcoidales bacterium]|nr:DegV family EDD domain-containing protein [Dehalococcoidales bacterium]